ncbi:lysozyme M1 (1,4-beta-N-acetylmuramidase) [Saprospira grandis DSM 2844]|uniref:Lysozyme M1 (1,4-beta-N-acetylmuramidase) n=1 Tax=Saprospira grandis DSM 2844 TaxID=694433 RepID=J0XTR8_9BACT|nr:GH25 family lysozyme [Saprospira grandis]EJF52331.1 lysozyme M1 (1,4-beta-N-acetylmuramidase) [Saprospira grandis DSM 2844]
MRFFPLLLLLPLLFSCKHQADDYVVKGLDISHYQKRIDWEQFDEKKVDFVFIKATEADNYQDSLFEHNWAALQKKNLAIGAYHFFRPQRSAIAQANFFLQTVPLGPGNLPPVLDVEELDGVGAEKLRLGVALWLNKVEEACQCKPIIYSSMKFYEDYLHPEFQDYPLWIARYNRKMPTTKNWLFWQYTNKGRHPGIPAQVDLNVFSASRQELKALLLN